MRARITAELLDQTNYRLRKRLAVNYGSLFWYRLR
jgi:hypothetical protein